MGTMEELGDRLGPLLLQLPPSFTVEGMDVLERFLEKLPEGFRYAVEVRDRSWVGSELPALLRGHRAALTLVDYPRMPRMEEAPADFAYVRWLGNRREFPSGHTHPKKTAAKTCGGGRVWWIAFSRRRRPSSPTRTTTTRTILLPRWTSSSRYGGPADGYTRRVQHGLSVPVRVGAGLLLGGGGRLRRVGDHDGRALGHPSGGLPGPGFRRNTPCRSAPCTRRSGAARGVSNRARRSCGSRSSRKRWGRG